MAAVTETLIKCACEFVGTFMLVFTVGCNSLGGTSSAWAGTSIACTLMVMVYCFGPVSGGHLNPAVSLAAGLAEKLSWHLVALYIVVQVGAGIAAGFCYCTLYGSKVALAPVGGFVWWEAMIVEVLYTGMLAFVVLNVACSKRNNPEGNPNQFYALAIGFVVIAGAYGAGSISGGSFNPAVSLGLDISSYNDGVWEGWLYSAYEFAGAVLATVLFRLTRPEDYRPEELESYQPKLQTRLASEFIGTFMLVFTVGLNVLASSTATAWSAAASLMCMIYALGDVSGGHFNPSVTLAVVLSRKSGLSVRDGASYMLFQVLGGVFAALLYSGLYKASTFSLAPKDPYTASGAYILEFVFTFVLAFAVLSTAYVKGITSGLSRNYYFALAIGSCVTAGGVAAGNVSGGYLNPALSIGIAISDQLNYGPLSYCLPYCLVELAGGLAAALFFHVTHAKEYAIKPAEPSGVSSH